MADASICCALREMPETGPRPLRAFADLLRVCAAHAKAEEMQQVLDNIEDDHDCRRKKKKKKKNFFFF